MSLALVFVSWLCCPLSAPLSAQPATLQDISSNVDFDGTGGKQRSSSSSDSVLNLQDFRGAVHVHTHLSHDSRARPEDLVRAANEIGLDFVMTTDHANPDIFTKGLEGMHGKTLFIRGEEIIKGGSGPFGACWPPSACNSILGVGMNGALDVKKLSMPELMKAVEEQGAPVIVAHPMGFAAWASGDFAGMEIYDLADNIMPADWTSVLPAIGRLVKHLFVVLALGRPTKDALIDGLERPDQHLKQWDELLRDRRVFGVGAPDAHQNMKYFGVQLDKYAETLRFPSVHILAAQLTQQVLLAALKNGRTYTAFDLIADSQGFKFFAWDDHDIYVQGDEVALAQGRAAGLTVQVPQEARIRLFKDGQRVQETLGSALDYAADAPGVYRVEAELKVKDDWKPWIFSNPIYVVSSGSRAHGDRE